MDQRIKQRSIAHGRVEDTYRPPRRKRSNPDHLIGDKSRERRRGIGCARRFLLIHPAISLVLAQGRVGFMLATRGRHGVMNALATLFGQ
jgi:hypothetical protein